jgi:hypothetical protein
VGGNAQNSKCCIAKFLIFLLCSVYFEGFDDNDF